MTQCAAFGHTFEFVFNCTGNIASVIIYFAQLGNNKQQIRPKFIDVGLMQFANSFMEHAQIYDIAFLDWKWELLVFTIPKKNTHTKIHFQCMMK